MKYYPPALFSECRQYRYTLNRRIGFNETVCNFIMLNPSTADEEKSDPTVTRCIGFARRWGYGVLCVTNIFALRSTDPRILPSCLDPIGSDNNYWIGTMARQADKVIVAWGNWGATNGRSSDIRALLSDIPLYHLELTGKGEPGHPLYLPSSTVPKLYGRV